MINRTSSSTDMEFAYDKEPPRKDDKAMRAKRGLTAMFHD